MNVHAWKSVVVLNAVFLLAGCGTFEERNFSAVQQGTKTQARNDRAGACFGLDRSVPPPPTGHEAGETLVGYENHLARGADPAPCNHRNNYAHQTVVKFDLSAYSADALITEAVLEADSRLILLMPVTEITRDCQNLLQTATEAWADGDFRGPASDPRAHVAAEGTRNWTPASARVSFNVLPTVKGWVNRGQPNHGFALSWPPTHGFAEENLSCLSALRNWNLRVKRFIPDPPSP